MNPLSDGFQGRQEWMWIADWTRLFENYKYKCVLFEPTLFYGKFPHSRTINDGHFNKGQ